MTMKKLAIVIPAFNEEAFIGPLLNKIEGVDTESLGYQKELIVVDDCSTDRTAEIVKGFPQVRLITQDRNRGKGAAVQRGIRDSTGDWVLVQDADLEYNPEDFVPMLEALSAEQGVAIYGSRLLGCRKKGLGLKHPDQEWGPWLATRLLTLWTFLLYGRWITDTTTAYKLYPSSLLKAFNIKTCGFETDHELTAKLIRAGVEIREVPVDYAPRSVKEGKKIRAVDFFIALWTLLRFRFSN